MRDIDNEIIELLLSEPMTPDDVARKLHVSWSTANGHLLKLAGEGKLQLVRKGRVNVYLTKRATVRGFVAPEWVKAKPLAQLADELEQYFPRNLTAAEMIEKERRKA